MTTTEKGKMMKMNITPFGVPINQGMSKKGGWGVEEKQNASKKEGF